MSSLGRDLAVGLDPARLMRAVGLTPDPWQVRVLTERPQRALLCCCRQAGKSTAAAAAVAHEALFTPGSLSLIVAPSQRQANELLTVVRMFLLVYKPGVLTANSSGELELDNGSRVVALPGRDDTIRGYAKVALICLDEAAWIPDEHYYTLRPMLAVSGGRLLALSTPEGQRGWFYGEWSDGTDWHRTSIKGSECPRISADFLAEERRTLTAARFAAEYECEFNDAVDSVFRSDDINAALDTTLTPIKAEGW